MATSLLPAPAVFGLSALLRNETPGPKALGGSLGGFVEVAEGFRFQLGLGLRGFNFRGLGLGG